MVVLENDLLKVEITENGGSLTSIYDKVNDLELLYQKDDRAWNGQDVVIFPFVARLKDSSYLVDGKEYSMNNHGIVRYSKLNVWESSKSKAILYLDSSNETLKQYPFNFHFEIIYALNNNTLSIRYKVTNKDDKAIYYSFGGHPALRVDGEENETGFVIKNTILDFHGDTKTSRYILDDTGSYITSKVDAVIPSNFIVTKNEIENAKTFIFDAKNILDVDLKTKGYDFHFNVSEAQVLAIWTCPGFGDYLCVEPWWGIPDILNPNKELKDKPLIHKLNPSQTEEKGFSITIIKE